MKPEARKKTKSSGRPRKAVVLLSGGLDSAANLAFAAESRQVVLALTANYGQRAFDSEWKAAIRIARYYKVKHRLIDLRWLGALGGSALTDSKRKVPTLLKNQLDLPKKTEKTAKAVWVPNRNGVLINAASAIAETLGADEVYVGFNAEEAATFPDNSTAFRDAATRALSFSTANRVEVACATDRWDKTRIVKELLKLKKPFPFTLVWSCYHSGRAPCGECESCRRFKRALGANGVSS